MKKLLLLAALATALIAPARADYLIKDGNGNPITVHSLTLGAAPNQTMQPVSTVADSSGTPYAIGNPLAVQFGTGILLPAFAATPTFNIGQTGAAGANNGVYVLDPSTNSPLTYTTTPTVSFADIYPLGATPVSTTTTGTTAATTATIAAVSGRTTYVCGVSIRSNATAAATGTATVTGLISGTWSFTHWTAPLASGIGITEPPIGGKCFPASGTNVAVAAVSPAPGAGGNVSVNIWGYYK